MLLARAQERKRQLDFLKKAGGQLTSKNRPRDDQPSDIINGEEAAIKQENVVEEEEGCRIYYQDDNHEDPDWTPELPSRQPSPYQLKNSTTFGFTASHSFSASPLVSEVTNCLLCNCIRKSTDFTPSLAHSRTEANFQVYFVLRKMLNVPKSKLMDYLVNFGDPRQWIQTCRDCLSVVDKAVRLQRDISKLEEKLRECQTEMRERITKSTTGKTKQHTLIGNINRVTVETRELVCEKNKLNEKGIKMNSSFTTSNCSGD